MKKSDQEQLVSGISLEVAIFFGLPEMPIKVVLIQSRAEYDRIWGKKSEDWMVGFTRNDKVYILAKGKFASDSNHPVLDFDKVLKHEISHLYYYKLRPNTKPVWLNEGLACYVAGQNKLPPKYDINIAILKEYHNHGGERVYALGRFMVNQIMDNYGKDKLFSLITIKSSASLYEELEGMFDWL